MHKTKVMYDIFGKCLYILILNFTFSLVVEYDRFFSDFLTYFNITLKGHHWFDSFEFAL